MIEVWLGNVGCLTFDTMISVNRGHKQSYYKLGYIHQQFHNNYKHKNKGWNLDIPTKVRSYDGNSIRLHTINDVIYSGIKKVYEIVLENGFKLKGTSNHEIMTDKGFVSIKKLNIDDNVMIDVLKKEKFTRNKFKINDIHVWCPLHPYKNKNNKVEIHRLIYEAKINNMKINDFLDIIWNDKDKIKNLKFINPKEYQIHHLDENHFNNSYENLVALTPQEHTILHKNYENFGVGKPSFSKLKTKKYVGEKATYDICCNDPHHNFVANGIVVHNSGKTASLVRELILNDSGRDTYSNIVTKKVKNNHLLSREMIFKKEVTGVKKNGEETYSLKFNIDFWKDLAESGEPINVVIDEAHTLLNPRKSMSKTNTIMTDFIALLRRILGENSSGYGKLVLITQLRRRVDVICREMANQFRYFLCHYNKTCRRCGYTFGENNENPEPKFICPKCHGRRLDKHSHTIEVFHFDSENSYLAWKTMGMKTHYRHYYIHDIEKYFKYYNTLQWDNLISEY